MSNTPKLVCVTGPDGAGKTTQISRLAEALESQGKFSIAVATIWDLLLDPETAPKVGFRSPIEVDRFLQILSPLSRALYLYNCFNEALVRARARQPDVLLINSYWYKYYATEVAHGADAEQILAIAERVFAEPDTTFYLEVDPRAAFARKAVLSGYETGFAEPRSEEAFVAFQVKAQAALAEQARRRRWISLDGNEPIESLTGMILARIGAVT